MSHEKDKEALLRKVFLDIARGYCKASCFDKPLFIKHLSIFDQEELDREYDQRVTKLKASGIISEEEKLKELNKTGQWTEKNEKAIRDTQAFADNLVKTKQALIIPSQIEQLTAKIKGAYEEATLKKQEKSALLGDTAESFASRYLNDISVYNSFPYESHT